MLGLAASTAALRVAVDVVGLAQIGDGICTGSNDIEGDGDMEDVDIDTLARRVTVTFEGSRNGVPPRCVLAPQFVLLRTAF